VGCLCCRFGMLLLYWVLVLSLGCYSNLVKKRPPAIFFIMRLLAGCLGCRFWDAAFVLGVCLVVGESPCWVRMSLLVGCLCCRFGMLLLYCVLVLSLGCYSSFVKKWPPTIFFIMRLLVDCLGCRFWDATFVLGVCLVVGESPCWVRMSLLVGCLCCRFGMLLLYWVLVLSLGCYSSFVKKWPPTIFFIMRLLVDCLGCRFWDATFVLGACLVVGESPCWVRMSLLVGCLCCRFGMLLLYCVLVLSLGCYSSFVKKWPPTIFFIMRLLVDCLGCRFWDATFVLGVCLVVGESPCWVLVLSFWDARVSLLGACVVVLGCTSLLVGCLCCRFGMLLLHWYLYCRWVLLESFYKKLHSAICLE
jgi:hypothetical protein